MVADRVKGSYVVQRPFNNNNTCRRRCVEGRIMGQQRTLLQCGVCVRVVKTIYSPAFALGVFLGPRKSLRPRKKGGVIKRLIKIGGHLPARVYAAHKLPVYYRHHLIYDRSSGARTQRRTPFVI